MEERALEVVNRRQINSSVHDTVGIDNKKCGNGYPTNKHPKSQTTASTEITAGHWHLLGKSRELLIVIAH